MRRSKRHHLLGLLLVVAAGTVSGSEWRHDRILGTAQATLRSSQAVIVRSFVDGSPVPLHAVLRIANGPHGTRAWLILQPEAPGMAMLDCGDGASGCEVSVSFDRRPPIPLRACFADGPYPPFEGVMFDASRALVEGLRRSRSVEVDAAVASGRSTTRARFRFEGGPLTFDAQHRQDVCEGEFAGDQGVPDR